MITVTHLTKQYGPRTAVHDLNFEVKKGEIVGFLGPNGAGKSTTMKILTGFMPASEGKVMIAGHDVFHEPIKVKQSIGFLPENPPVYPEMSVNQYLDFAARLHQVPPKGQAAAIANTLKRVGLWDVRHRLIQNLSKGYRQRVGLAQALVHNPPVLILDEPTVGLDPKQIIEIRELIKSLRGDHTVLLSSHILPEVTATCDRVIVLNRGKIVAEDTIDHLTSRAQGGLIYALTVRNVKAAGVEALMQLGKIHTTGNRLTIELKSEDAREKVIETAVKHDMGVLEFVADKVSLEDIFLKLTTNEGSLA